MKKIVLSTTLLFTALLFVATIGNAQSIDKKKYNSNKEGEDKLGYTQAVKVGNTIYISGIPARGPLNEAIKKVYDRLEKILASYNATLENVVKETAYTTNIEELIKYQDLRKGYYKGDYPASTWVEIKRLYSPEAALEIDFVAVVKEL